MPFLKKKSKSKNTNLDWEDKQDAEQNSSEKHLRTFTKSPFTYASSESKPPSFVQSKDSRLGKEVDEDESIISREMSSTMQSHAFWSQLEVDDSDEDEEVHEDSQNKITDEANVLPDKTKSDNKGVLSEWNDEDKVELSRKVSDEEIEYQDSETYVAKMLEYSASFCALPSTFMQNLENNFMDYCGDHNAGASSKARTEPTYAKEIGDQPSIILANSDNATNAMEQLPPQSSLHTINDERSPSTSSELDKGLDKDETLSRVSGLSSTWSASEKNIYLLRLAKEAQQNMVTSPVIESDEEKTVDIDDKLGSSSTVNSEVQSTIDDVPSHVTENKSVEYESNDVVEETDHYRSSERFIPISSSPVQKSNSDDSYLSQTTPVLIKPEPRLSNLSEEIENDSEEIDESDDVSRQDDNETLEPNPLSSSEAIADDETQNSSNYAKSSSSPCDNEKPESPNVVNDQISRNVITSSRGSEKTSSVSVSKSRSARRKRSVLKRKSKQWHELNSDEESDKSVSDNEGSSGRARTTEVQVEDSTSNAAPKLQDSESNTTHTLQDKNEEILSTDSVGKKEELGGKNLSLPVVCLSPSDESGLKHPYADEECSLATYHTSQTALSSASQWSVSGRERYMRAMKANENNTSKGWQDSMSKAAKEIGHVWTAERGWIDLPKTKAGRDYDNSNEKKSQDLIKVNSAVDLDEIDDNSIGSSISRLSPTIRKMIEKKRIRKGKDKKVTFSLEPVKVHMEKCSEEDLSLFVEEDDTKIIHTRGDNIVINEEVKEELRETNLSNSDDDYLDTLIPIDSNSTVTDSQRNSISSSSEEEDPVVVIETHAPYEDSSDGNLDRGDEDFVITRTNDLINRLEGKNVDIGLNELQDTSNTFHKSLNAREPTKHSFISQGSKTHLVKQLNKSSDPSEVNSLSGNPSKVESYVESNCNSGLSQVMSSMRNTSTNIEVRKESSGVKSSMKLHSAQMTSSEMSKSSEKQSQDQSYNHPNCNDGFSKMLFSMKPSTDSELIKNTTVIESSKKLVSAPATVSEASSSTRNQSQDQNNSESARDDDLSHDIFSIRKSPDTEMKEKSAQNIRNMAKNSEFERRRIESFDASTVSTKFTNKSRMKPAFSVEILPSDKGEEEVHEGNSFRNNQRSQNNDKRKLPSLLQRLNCAVPDIPNCNASETSISTKETASTSGDVPMAHLSFMKRVSPTDEQLSRLQKAGISSIKEESSADESDLDSFLSNSDLEKHSRTEKSFREIPNLHSEESLSTNVGGSRVSDSTQSVKNKLSYRNDAESGKDKVSRNGLSHHTSSSPSSWQLLLAKRASKKLADQKSMEARERAERTAAVKVEEMMHALSLSDNDQKMEDKRVVQKKKLDALIAEKWKGNKTEERKLKDAEKSAALVVENMMQRLESYD